MKTHGSLFNGIGGFQIAAHWMGWTNVFYVEIDEFCNKVVKKHFPNSIQHGDIRETDFMQYRGAIDVLSGGFPCQPFSNAGQRKGTEDDRHLWPEMLRAIREIQPRWVVGENVRGFTNWNGGMVFDQVQADLEAEGYEVLPFLLPAAGVGAPHRRDRIWIVANANGFGRDKKDVFSQQQGRTKTIGTSETRLAGIRKKLDATNPFGIGQQGQGRTEQPFNKTENRDWKASWANDDGGWPTQSPVCNGDDGISSGLVDISFQGWCLKSLQAMGNAIVPQIAYQIFKAIDAHDLPRP